jgi:hypothetical protein
MGWLWPRPATAPSRTRTAPTGTSPAAAAEGGLGEGEAHERRGVGSHGGLAQHMRGRPGGAIGVRGWTRAPGGLGRADRRGSRGARRGASGGPAARGLVPARAAGRGRADRRCLPARGDAGGGLRGAHAVERARLGRDPGDHPRAPLGGDGVHDRPRAPDAPGRCSSSTSRRGRTRPKPPGGCARRGSRSSTSPVRARASGPASAPRRATSSSGSTASVPLELEVAPDSAEVRLQAARGTGTEVAHDPLASSRCRPSGPPPAPREARARSRARLGRSPRARLNTRAFFLCCPRELLLERELVVHEDPQGAAAQGVVEVDAAGARLSRGRSEDTASRERDPPGVGAGVGETLGDAGTALGRGVPPRPSRGAGPARERRGGNGGQDRAAAIPSTAGGRRASEVVGRDASRPERACWRRSRRHASVSERRRGATRSLRPRRARLPPSGAAARPRERPPTSSANASAVGYRSGRVLRERPGEHTLDVAGQARHEARGRLRLLVHHTMHDAGDGRAPGRRPGR